MNTIVRNSRPHCTCVTVQNYGYDAAAVKLGCKARFLEDRIRHLPHQKLGGSVAFCDCELRIVQQMFTVIPDEVWDKLIDSAANSAPPPVTSPSIRTIKPAGARRPQVAALG